MKATHHTPVPTVPAAPCFPVPSRSGAVICWAILFTAMLPLRLTATSVWQMSLVGDMYDEGRKLTHPTREQPVYYFPVVLGFAELGAKIAGDKPPPAKGIVHELALALAVQGYRVSREIEVPAPAGSATATPPAAHAKALEPPPSLILVFSWGSLRPEKMDVNADVMDSTPPVVLNQNQMLGLIAGKNFDSIVDFSSRTQEIWSGVQDDRYFVMISAYDFNAYQQQHKKVRLWVAKVSVPADGENMAEVLPALIKTGGAIFGHETIGPTVLDVPTVREGRVEIGTPVVVPNGKP